MSCKNCNGNCECKRKCEHQRCPHKHFLNEISFTLVPNVSLTFNVTDPQFQVGDEYDLRTSVLFCDNSALTGNENIFINDGTNTIPVNLLCSGAHLKSGNLRRRLLLRMVYKNPGQTPATAFLTVHDCQVCDLIIKPTATTVTAG